MTVPFELFRGRFSEFLHDAETKGLLSRGEPDERAYINALAGNYQLTTIIGDVACSLKTNPAVIREVVTKGLLEKFKTAKQQTAAANPFV